MYSNATATKTAGHEGGSSEICKSDNCVTRPFVYNIRAGHAEDFKDWAFQQIRKGDLRRSRKEEM